MPSVGPVKNQHLNASSEAPALNLSLTKTGSLVMNARANHASLKFHPASPHLSTTKPKDCGDPARGCRLHLRDALA